VADASGGARNEHVQPPLFDEVGAGRPNPGAKVAPFFQPIAIELGVTKLAALIDREQMKVPGHLLDD
jgi:hypothetical protein